jgi:GTP cyclohydrolase I
MKDVQGGPDHRGMPIEQVGIRGLRYPITVRDRSAERQHTVASVSLGVNLPHHYRGTHMSRFVEVLDRHASEISYHTLEEILGEIRRTLDAEESHVEVTFPYFMRRRAPVSGLEATMSYDCTISATLGAALAIATRVEVPVHTLCPCSREIATVSAHNQRGRVTMSVGMTRFVWIEELIEIAEASGSSPLFALMKREDEKHVTEHAYENPRFVEDVVREAALRLDRLAGLRWYTVEAENFESIHDHSAYAVITRRKDG